MDTRHLDEIIDSKGLLDDPGMVVTWFGIKDTDLTERQLRAMCRKMMHDRKKEQEYHRKELEFQRFLAKAHVR